MKHYSQIIRSPLITEKGTLVNEQALISALQAKKIAVAPIPETGLGEAINDRLKRAAAPRP